VHRFICVSVQCWDEVSREWLGLSHNFCALGSFMSGRGSKGGFLILRKEDRI
jgi:hypothetical protein